MNRIGRILIQELFYVPNAFRTIPSSSPTRGRYEKQQKEAFQRISQASQQAPRDFGVIISEYLSDNATAFTSAEYREHLSKFAQVSQYAGVGAHHHNGIAERSIQTVMSIARTMMLHAAIHWPDVAENNFDWEIDG